MSLFFSSKFLIIIKKYENSFIIFANKKISFPLNFKKKLNFLISQTTNKMESLMDPLREDKSNFNFLCFLIFIFIFLFFHSGNYSLAKETVEIIISIIKVKDNLLEIVNLIQELKKTLKETHPFKFTISNVIRKTMIIIIERCLINNLDISAHKKLMQEKNLLQKKASSVNFSNEVMGLIQILDDQNEEIANKMKKIKMAILNELSLFYDEFEQVSESINKYANSHINSNEVIMTFEHSTTILNFLLEAHKTRFFAIYKTIKFI